jgi:hypothetical protein
MKAIEIWENRIGFVRLAKSFCEYVSIEEWGEIFKGSRIVSIEEKEGIRKYVLYKKEFEPVQKGESIPEYSLTVYTDQINNDIDSVVWSRLKVEDHNLYKKMKELCEEINERFSNKGENHIDENFIDEMVCMMLNELPRYAIERLHSRLNLISKLL